MLSSIAACAQPAGTFVFEAASVKATDPAKAAASANATLRGGPGTSDPGRISWSNVTLQSLLITAYGASCPVQTQECDQVVGPAWLRSNRYDVEAKIPAGTQLLRAGFLISPVTGTRATANHLMAREQSLADFTKMLINLLSTHVVDKTGIEGKYNFTLDWVPDGVTLQQAPDALEITPPHGIPTALEDQLGLKLVQSKIRPDTVVVDSVDRTPAEN